MNVARVVLFISNIQFINEIYLLQPTPFLILKNSIYTYNVMCSGAQPIVTQFRYFPLDYERLYDDDVALLGKIKLSFITVAVVTGEND